MRKLFFYTLLLLSFLSPIYAQINEHAFITWESEIWEANEDGSTETYTGTVTIDETVPSGYYLSLYPRISSEELLYVSSVYISAGEDTGSFTYRPINNNILSGDQVVELVFYADDTDVCSSSIRILEDESKNIVLSLPDVLFTNSSIILSEDSTGANYPTIQLGGISSFDRVIQLQSNNPAVQVPTEVIIEAGSDSVHFEISVSESTQLDTVTISASSDDLISGEASTVIESGDVGRIDLELRGDLFAANQAISMKLKAYNEAGKAIDFYNGTIDFFFVSESGEVSSDIALKFSGFSSDFDIQIPFVGTGVEFKWKDPSSEDSFLIGSFDTFAVLDAEANNLVYDSNNDLLFASFGADAPEAFQNTIAKIDPVSLEKLASIHLDGEATVMAITDDSSRLYVGLHNASSVAIIDLESFSLIKTFTLAEYQYVDTGDYSTFWPIDILTVEGRPELLLVSQDDVNSTECVIMLYEDGVKKSVRYNSYPVVELASANDPDFFYGFDTRSTGQRLYRFHMNEEGIEFPDTFDNSIQYSASMHIDDIQSAANRILTNTGHVYNAFSFDLIGKLKLNGSDFSKHSAGMAVDEARNRIHYVVDEVLESFDLTTLKRIKHYDLNAPTISSPKSLIKVAEHGLVCLYGGGKIAMIPSEYVDTDPIESDLAICFTQEIQAAQIGQEHRLNLKVSNDGNYAVNDVRVSVELDEGLELINSEDYELISQTEQSIEISLGTLNGKEDQEFELFVIATEEESFLGLKACVYANHRDSDLKNNKAISAVSVGYELPVDSSRVIASMINDMLWSNSEDLLILALSSWQETVLAGQVIALEPNTGIIHWLFDPIDYSVSKMCLSEDESKLFMNLINTPTIVCMNLNTKQEEYRFNVSDKEEDVVHHMLVLKNTNDSLLVHSGEASEEDTTYVSVYDRGIMRQNSFLQTGRAASGMTTTADPNKVLLLKSRFYELYISPTGVEEINSIYHQYVGGALMSHDNEVLGTGSSGIIDASDLSLLGSLKKLSYQTDYDYDKYFYDAENSQYIGINVSGSQKIATFSIYGKRDYNLKVNFELDVLALETIDILKRYAYDGIAMVGENSNIVFGQNDRLVLTRSSWIPNEASAEISLILDQPSNDSAVIEFPLTLEGRAASDGGIASVTVNGVTASSDDGFMSWSLDVNDFDENGEILIRATDALDSSISESILISEALLDSDWDSDQLFDVWEEQYFNGDIRQGNPADDLDQDGRTNLEEQILGMSPIDSNNESSLRVLAIDGDTVTISVTQLKDEFAYNYQIKHSSDLINWYDSMPYMNYIESVEGPTEVHTKNIYSFSRSELAETIYFMLSVE